MNAMLACGAIIIYFASFIYSVVHVRKPITYKHHFWKN